MQSISKRIQRRHGAALGLAVALAMVLIIISVGLFSISMYFGGAHEATNAADAGALNLGKKVATIPIPLQPGLETAYFADVADNGNVTMANINRLWSKAMLTSINEYQMNAEGAEQNYNNHALMDTVNMQTDMEKIDDRLRAATGDPTTLSQFYLDYASQNSLKMLGKNSHMRVQNNAGWGQSFVDRAISTTYYESNIQVDPGSQFPLNYDASKIPTVAPTKDPNHRYLRGYYSYITRYFGAAGGVAYSLIPFRFAERPHLISQSDFNNNTDGKPLGALFDGHLPLPNAFSTIATGANDRYGALATACVQVNPQKIYNLAMPGGYVRILIHKNNLQWQVNGDNNYSVAYGFAPDQIDMTKFTLPCGDVWANEFVGNEYATSNSLFTAMFALPPIPPTGSVAFQYLLQRVCEIHPGYTSPQLIALLKSINMLPSAQDQEFAIYNSSYDSNAPLVISTLASAPTNMQAQPDGTVQTLDNEGPSPGPNNGTTHLDCFGQSTYPSVTTVEAQRVWTPGTGATSDPTQNGCLGKLEVRRTTTANLIVN